MRGSWASACPRCSRIWASSQSNLAYLVLVAVGLLDSWLLYRFFSVQLPQVKRNEELARSRIPPAEPVRPQG